MAGPATAEPLEDIATCTELHPDLDFCECEDTLPDLGHGEIRREAKAAAITASTLVASVPGVAAACEAIERCCACAQTNQEQRESTAETRHVCFEGAICVEEFAGYVASGSGTNNKRYIAEKVQACVVNNGDNIPDLGDTICPPDLSFCDDE